MSKIKEIIPPVSPTYLVEMTQDEIDVIAGLAHDLADGRTVYMVYPVDGDAVKPTERGMEILRNFAAPLVATEAEDYDYFDYWEAVTEDQIKQISDEDKPLRW